MKRWRLYLNKANDYANKSDDYLQKAVRSLAKEKGFNREQICNFAACFATGGETVVSYNHKGEMSDLDVSIMADMTKDEIIDRLNENGNVFDL